MVYAKPHPNVARKRQISRQAFIEAEELRKRRFHAAVIKTALAAAAARQAEPAAPAPSVPEQRKAPVRDARGRFIKVSA